MLDERTLATAADAAGLSALAPVRQLGGSDRSEVWRVADDDGATYVVKRYLSRDGGTYAREPAALEALVGGHSVPRLLGTAHDPDLMVLEDLGSFPTVADVLLGRDPAAAQAAVDGWVDAVADLHLAGTEDVLDAYGRQLGLRAPDITTHRVPVALADTAADYAQFGERLGVPASAEFVDTLRDVASRLTTAPPVLTAADACPDNNMMTPDGVVLLDYEFAEVRHLVWDVAYLSVPWPTCWCAWRLPDDVVAAAIARYRERVAPAVPYVASAAFDADLSLATLAWCLMASSWRIGAALEEDQAPSAGLDGPTLRPVVLHRLWLASHLPGPGVLTSYARDLLRELTRRWGEPTLVLAPAFRAGDILIP